MNVVDALCTFSYSCAFVIVILMCVSHTVEESLMSLKGLYLQCGPRLSGRENTSHSTESWHL